MRGAPDYCPNCGTAVLRARGGAGDVVLDPQPSEMGTVWIDAQDRARAVSQFYVEGQARYRPHQCARMTVAR